MYINILLIFFKHSNQSVCEKKIKHECEETIDKSVSGASVESHGAKQ